MAAARFALTPLPPLARLPMLLLAMLALVVGVLAGLARLTVEVPVFAASQAGAHGALMIAAFLGAVISLERAVALARGWPYLAPLCAGLGGLALVSGLPLGVAQPLFIAAGLLLCAGSLLIVRQQPALHTATLALGALCWLVGSLVWSVGGAIGLAVPWWMAFLVLTIAGERLELTRFLPSSPAAKKTFVLFVGLAGIGLTTGLWSAASGLALLATSLFALALWLLRHDIARHTVRQRGLTRYMAVCLLSGYAWLAWGGLLGLAGGFAAGDPLRDAALHAIFLGFVFSMIFGHAPIIFPAVAKVRIPYHPAFYLPLAALHLSLLLREIGDLAGLPALIRHAGIGNAAALLLFILTMLISVGRGRRPAPTPPTHRPGLAPAKRGPMKRSGSLLKLSREHHGALVLAKRAQSFGPTRSDAADVFMAQLVRTFADELEPHFQAEENTLLPALQLAGESALVERTLAEHAQLRELIERIRHCYLSSLQRFGIALAAHVRFEERELFPAAEAVLPPATLTAIETRLHYPHPQPSGV